MAVRVLQVAPTLGYGGVAQVLCNYLGHLDPSRVSCDIFSHGATAARERQFASLGVRVISGKTLGQSGLRNYIQSVRSVLRRHGPYDAVHIHTNYQAGIVAFAARLEGISKRICHVHGTLVDPRNARLFLMYRLLIFANCTTLIACSSETGRRYFAPRRFAVIPNAIKVSDFTAPGDRAIRDRLGVGMYDWVFGHVGRFTAEKNHEFLLQVLFRFRTEGRRACLLCVGEGPLLDKVRALAGQLGLAQHVQFLGAREDVPDILKAVDVLLLPSFSEGMPLSVLEAQATGIPSVVSSTVTRDVDLGLGLVRFASLQAPDEWVRLLLPCNATLRPDSSVIELAFAKHRYDAARSASAFEALYQPTEPPLST